MTTSHERRHKWHAQFSNDERRVGNLAAGRLCALAKEASLAGCSRLHLPPGSKTVGFCRSARERSTNSEYKWPRIRGWKMPPRSGPPSGLPSNNQSPVDATFLRVQIDPGSRLPEICPQASCYCICFVLDESWQLDVDMTDRRLANAFGLKFCLRC